MRVTAGRHRGRRLRATGARGLRPTSDRARAGLFDWIGPRIAGARVVDLFAGTGSIGIEAISRGARSSVFVERARPALDLLRENLESLGLGEQSRVLALDVVRALRTLARDEGEFDFVFIDPPYASGWGPRLARSPDLLDLPAADGIIIFERSRRDEEALSEGVAWQLEGMKMYGDTVFDWYQRRAEATT